MSPFALVGLGALVAIAIVGLGTLGVALVVRRHERREDAAAARRHAEMTRHLDDMKRLTLRAIAGRAELERQVEELREVVNDHAERIDRFPGGAPARRVVGLLGRPVTE